MTAVDVLLAARDAIGPDTWTQGVLYRGADGRDTARATASRSCVMGHLVRASDRVMNEPTEAIRLLVKSAGIDPGTLTDWNDEPGRIWQDVWDALDRAATLAKDMSS